ncbi:MAG: hypothetical protein COZ06_33485 [Armatimonadetes bacterium CG_4_10_14_3_um_filter_66_18]|nr:hypothetical protein [Armatimonadota bacterium]PIU88518.1 MAG: hypothetical protein COS65_30540 [Armatimonadetes bacterium CG06_land_8_20_14_3_00_66_21]PIX47436.1 MAG: hypothetical protein COZ57_08430 [Armatimonadetes bacterium CG_4_8_14_3_um_filter_66_20]PIY37148.1 MAG: hypothetical protein COZ06_33485 [Armatimonadetes bacterium CG_4_10_14_3_um_filter_66_18]PJB73439.1 MAG: hypothetical protein CO096_05885 [Armatimonadetes bacterium CG_4_9_14_3_um_filter_66_14]
MFPRLPGWARAPQGRRVIVGVSATLFVLAGIGAGYVSLRFPREGLIQRDVLLEGRPVGGLTREAARLVVEEETTRALAKEVRLAAHGQEWSFTCRQLGASPQLEEVLGRAYRVGRTGSWFERARMAVAPHPQPRDLRTRYVFDEGALTAILKQLKDQVRTPCQDAYAELRDGVIRVEPGKWGESLDVDNSRQKVMESIANPREAGKVDLVLKSEKPGISYEDLKHLDCVLVEYATTYNSSKVNRTHNLRVAGSFLDKVLLRAGVTFSYNDIVGPRLECKGYRPAAIFANGDVVDDIGGGVCQVASTMYNVALLAGLKIVQRRPHSRPVDYCPPGRDATVYFGQTDLRFRNNTALPLYFRTSVGSGRVRVMALGNRSQRVQVELTPVDREVIPYKVVELEDRSLSAGQRVEDESGRDGLRLGYRRLIKQGGETVVEELISRDYFKPQDRIVRVGVGAEPPGKVEPPAAAKADPQKASPRPSGTAPSVRPQSPRIEDLAGQ